MIKPLYGARAIKDQLKADGKVVTLNQPEHIAIVVKTNKNLLEARRDFQVKAKNSKKQANQLLLK